jgi:hypothetical protein
MSTMWLISNMRVRFHAVLLATCAVVALSASAAQAATLGFVDGSVTGLSASTQAGAHADFSTGFRVTTDSNGNPTSTAKRISTELPRGLVGNPQATPECTGSRVLNPFGAGGMIPCPRSTIVGVATFDLNFGPGSGTSGPTTVFVYNVEPTPGSPAALEFLAMVVGVRMDVSVEADGNYGIHATINNVSEGYPLLAADVTLWGVPADHQGPGPLDTAYLGSYGAPLENAPRVPFMSNPTRCDGQPLQTIYRATPWRPLDIAPPATAGLSPAQTGCADVPFTPATTVATSTSDPDAPTGLDVDIASPQNLDDPDGLATAHLKDVTVELPDGLTINPGSANGLEACTDGQLGLGSDVPIACPAGSKIGDAVVKTPVLNDAIEGGVYLRTQASGDPESGDLFRLALVVRDPVRGILVKLPGNVRADAATGKLTASFLNNPQLPVESIKVQLKSGPRAPLATSQGCGTSTVNTHLVSWAGHDRVLPSPLGVKCAPGLGGFAPSISAGASNPVGAAFSPFTVGITKPDGNVAVTGLTMSMPAGLLAKLKGNLNTQVGSVTAFAGSGAHPYALPGKVLLEGRYGDAPFSLRAVVPALAGPFDLGEVVVRQKIYVDPIDAHVTVVSDPLPTIVKGVPVRLQRLDVNVDKPGFMINPTSCDPKTIGGTLSSATGQSVPIGLRFQVGDCTALGLEPKLDLSFTGRGETTDGKHPGVVAELSQPFGGQANLKKVGVKLPLSVALDPDNANALCEFVDGSKVTPTCPAASIVGTATAVTPILDEPLTGPVYFVKNVRKDPKSGRDIKTLPKLVIPLAGQNGVKLTLTGTSDVVDDQLVTTFANIPDAPVSSFTLKIDGGKHGILAVSGDKIDICAATQKAVRDVDGHNNASADREFAVKTPDCRLKVASASHTAKALVLKVGGLGAGKVTVSGNGIKKTSRTIASSTVATLKPALTKATRNRLATRHDVRVKVKVAYTPAGGKTVSASKTLTIHAVR